MPETQLEREIAAWRARMMAALPGRPETVRELEEHLRDEIAGLMRGGVAAATAFAHAVDQLGEAGVLAREFQRVRSRWFAEPGSSEVRLLAYTSGVLGILGGVGYLSASIRWASLFLSGKFDFTNGLRDLIYATLTVVLVVVCGLAIRASNRMLSCPNARAPREVIGFTLFVIWMLASNRLWWLGYAREWFPLMVCVVGGGLLMLWRRWLASVCAKRGDGAASP